MKGRCWRGRLGRVWTHRLSSSRAPVYQHLGRKSSKVLMDELLGLWRGVVRLVLVEVMKALMNCAATCGTMALPAARSFPTRPGTP